MKILHLLYESKGDYFGIGGVGIRAYELYGRLAERHEITLLCKKYPGSPEESVIEGLRHVFVGTRSPRLSAALLSYAYAAAWFVRRWGDRFDIVVEEFSPAIPTFLCLFRRRPVVLQIQGFTGRNYFVKYNPLYSSFLYGAERFTPRLYRNIIVVSGASAKRYRFGASSRVEVISNGVDSGLVAASPQESGYIIYLGRIDIHHKGLDILLHAFDSFCRHFPGIKLVVAGDGRDRKKFLGLLGSLRTQVSRNIELKGWVDGKEKEDLLSSSLFAVVPSRYETQGIAALEALACAKPVIVSDIPELAYVPSAGAGLSFRCGDAEGLSEAMETLFLRQDRLEMGKKGRALVMDATWDRIASRYEEFLQDIVRPEGTNAKKIDADL